MFNIGPVWPQNQDPPHHHEKGAPREDDNTMDAEQFAHLLDNAMGNASYRRPDKKAGTSITPPLPPDPWEEVARRFDVRAMDVRALANLSLALYEAGAITTLDHLILSASPEDTELPWGSPLLTAGENPAAIDWIEEFKARREVAWGFHHTKSVEELDRLLAHLTRIDAIARGWRARAI